MVQTESKGGRIVNLAVDKILMNRFEVVRDNYIATVGIPG
jgi:hypothetical protein